MTYYRGATEVERLANAESDGYRRGYRAGQEEMRERCAAEDAHGFPIVDNSNCRGLPCRSAAGPESAVYCPECIRAAYRAGLDEKQLALDMAVAALREISAQHTTLSTPALTLADETLAQIENLVRNGQKVSGGGYE